MAETQIPYWDVFPKSIKLMWTDSQIYLPLSVHGSPRGTVIFESMHPAIADVDSNGHLTIGALIGSTIIVAYDSEDRTSARYVQVEITQNENTVLPS